MNHNFFLEWCVNDLTLQNCTKVYAFPGRPSDSGISLDVVRSLGSKIPIFGVCMGHQCIGEVFGGKVW